jgi:hypothetical protein
VDAAGEDGSGAGRHRLDRAAWTGRAEPAVDVDSGNSPSDMAAPSGRHSVQHQHAVSVWERLARTDKRADPLTDPAVLAWPTDDQDDAPT